VLQHLVSLVAVPRELEAGVFLKLLKRLLQLLLLPGGELLIL
jgi:hypothetical protein